MERVAPQIFQKIEYGALKKKKKKKFPVVMLEDRTRGWG